MNLSNPALLSCALLGLLCGALGHYLLVRRMAVFSDMLGHSTLLGICVAFIIFPIQKNILIISLGAFLSTLMATFLHEFFSQKFRVNNDASLAIILSGFYAIGVMLMSWVNGNFQGEQAGLQSYLLGEAAALNWDDFFIFLGLSLLSACLIILFYRPFLYSCFDPLFCKVQKKREKVFQFLLSFLIALTVIFALKAVGIVLACALLVIPSASSIFLSKKMHLRIAYSAVIGALCAYTGAFFSLQYDRMPTGPTIILISTFFFLCTLFFGNEKGLLKRLIKKRKLKKRTQLEDLLKSAYRLEERYQRNELSKLELMSEMKSLSAQYIGKQIQRAIKKGFLVSCRKKLSLSDKGRGLAAEMVRKHRIWELYLATKLEFKEDQVHLNAEIVEHFLTPQIVNEIEELLGRGTKDPHGQIIPSIEDLRKYGIPGY